MTFFLVFTSVHLFCFVHIWCSLCTNKINFANKSFGTEFEIGVASRNLKKMRNKSAGAGVEKFGNLESKSGFGVE